MSSFATFAFALLLVGPASGRLVAQQTAQRTSRDASSPVSAPAHHITISWQKVSGAVHYEVVIRPLGGDATIDEQTDATYVAVVLAPGTYQVRVISFNIFDKPASLSRWRKLEVVRVYRPIVDRLTPKSFYSGLAHQSLVVEGKFFLPETAVDLMQGGSVVAHGRIDTVRDVKLLVQLDLSGLPPGSYDLRLTNPDDLVLLMKGAIRVRERAQPQLTSISLSRGYDDRVYRGVEVVGHGFSAGTTFSLQNGAATVSIRNVIVRSASRALMDIDLGNAKPGPYRLLASNPGGLSTQIEDAVTVENIRTPEFVSMSPTTFTVGRDSGDFTLTAKDLLPDAQVFLKKGGTLIPTESFADGASVTRVFRIDLSTIEPGTYDLLIRNSRLLTALDPHLVTVKPRQVPRLTSSSLTHAYNSVSYPKVVLLGQNLEPRYTVVLKRGTVMHDLATRYVSNRQLDVAVDFRGIAPGNYDVLVQDSGHVVASLPGGITVGVPHRRYVHPMTYRLLVGYPYQLVLSQSFASSVTSSYAGGTLAAAFPVGEKFFPRAPLIRDTGLELNLGYSQFSGTSSGSSANASLGVFKTGFNLYYRTPFNFPINAVARLGYGITMSRYSMPTVSGTASGTSYDFYYDIGLGGELDVGKRLSFEAGATWTRILYPLVNLDTLAVEVSSGVRLGG